MKVAEYVAQVLADNSPGTVFMLSGTGSIHLDDAIAKQPGLSYVCARHEATAAIMAAASSRVSGKVGAVVVTTGPGAVNAIAGVVEAWVDSTPLLVISGQVANDQIAPGVRTFGVQGFDVLALAAPTTKYAQRVSDPATIRFHLERALHEAKSGRPGPAWLDIPFDVQAHEIGDGSSLEGFVAPPAPARRSIAAELGDVLGLLRSAQRPLVILGQGVRQGGAAAQFLELVDALGAPVVATRSASGLMAYGHGLYMGVGGIRGRPHTGLVMEQADLVLSLGSSLAHGFVGEQRDAFAPGARIVMVDTDAAELDKAAPHLPLRIDVKFFIEELLAALPGARLPAYAAWSAQCRKLKAAHPIVQAEQRGDPINSYHLVQRLEAHASASHIFVSDTGGAYYTTGQALTFDRSGQRELTSSVFANMGIALPIAIGAACADRAAQVICLSGDGSLELNIQELRTIVQYGLAIKVFVINNGGYGSIRDSQDEFCEGNYTDDTEVLDFGKVAAAFGLPFARIASAAELDTAIAAVLAGPGAVLVEVVCDARQQIRTPLRARDAVPSALQHA